MDSAHSGLNKAEGDKDVMTEQREEGSAAMEAGRDLEQMPLKTGRRGQPPDTLVSAPWF